MSDRLREAEEQKLKTDNVKVQMTRRNDGRHTVTIKLIGWRLPDLYAFIARMSSSRSALELNIAEEVTAKLRVIVNNRRS